MRIKSLEHLARPLEKNEQMAVAGWLDAIDVLWVHIPNERMVNHLKTTTARVAYMQSLYRQGLKKGFPDVLIFDPPPLHQVYVGTAFELKRKGERPTDNQLDRLNELTGCGWKTGWFEGAESAIEWLKSLGYGKKL